MHTCETVTKTLVGEVSCFAKQYYTVVVYTTANEFGLASALTVVDTK